MLCLHSKEILFLQDVNRQKRRRLTICTLGRRKRHSRLCAVALILSSLYVVMLQYILYKCTYEHQNKAAVTGDQVENSGEGEHSVMLDMMLLDMCFFANNRSSVIINILRKEHTLRSKSVDFRDPAPSICLLQSTAKTRGEGSNEDALHASAYEHF